MSIIICIDVDRIQITNDTQNISTIIKILNTKITDKKYTSIMLINDINFKIYSFRYNNENEKQKDRWIIRNILWCLTNKKTYRKFGNIFDNIIKQMAIQYYCGTNQQDQVC